MQFSDAQILPIPSSVFYFTGISLATLFYVTFASTINKIPAAIGQQLNNVSNTITNVASSLDKSTTNLYSPTTLKPNPVAGPTPISGTSPTNAPQKGVIDNVSNTLSSLNPFSKIPPEQRPPQIGGSKKKGKKLSKKTRRAKQ